MLISWELLYEFVEITHKDQTCKENTRTSDLLLPVPFDVYYTLAVCACKVYTVSAPGFLCQHVICIFCFSQLDIPVKITELQTHSFCYSKSTELFK